MNSAMLNYLIFIIIVLFLGVSIVVSIVKKGIKLVMYAVVILCIFAGYNYYSKGISPVEFFKGIKVDILCVKSTGQNFLDVKKSVSNIKETLDKKKVDDAAVNTIKDENSKLHKYETQAKLIEHSKNLDKPINMYNGYLSQIVQASDKLVVLTDKYKGKDLGEGKEVIDKLIDNLNGLEKMKFWKN